MSPDRSPRRDNPPTRRARLTFYAALALFGAWVVGLGVMAYTTAERPVPGASPAPASLPE